MSCSKQKNPILCLAVVCQLAGTASADTLFYGGDFDGRDMRKNQDTAGNDFAYVYEDFVVAGNGWQISSIFSNNALSSGSTPGGVNYQIRTGVSAGNGGTLLYSGTLTPTVAPPAGPYSA